MTVLYDSIHDVTPIFKCIQIKHDMLIRTSGKALNWSTLINVNCSLILFLIIFYFVVKLFFALSTCMRYHTFSYTLRLQCSGIFLPRIKNIFRMHSRTLTKVFTSFNLYRFLVYNMNEYFRHEFFKYTSWTRCDKHQWNIKSTTFTCTWHCLHVCVWISVIRDATQLKLH